MHARGTGIDTPHLHYSFFILLSLLSLSLSPPLSSLKNDNGRIRTYAPDGNCLAGSRLDRSATLSSTSYPFLPSPPLLFLTPSSSFFFSKKRQWQDLNLRIQRIIDFKSIALDHSATLSTRYFFFTLPSLLSLLPSPLLPFILSFPFRLFFLHYPFAPYYL